jgi:hypothetical protein
MYGILTGVITYLCNKFENELSRSVGLSSRGLLETVLGMGIIVFVITLVFYLLKGIIPGLRKASTVWAGIVLLLLTYLILTTLSLFFTWGGFDPLGGKYLLDIFLRFGILFFMPLTDRLIERKLTS